LIGNGDEFMFIKMLTQGDSSIWLF
jgi:hypothetical protein